MASNYTVEDVLNYLDVGLPEDEDSDDDFDGYTDDEEDEEEGRDVDELRAGQGEEAGEGQEMEYQATHSGSDGKYF